MEAAKGTNSGSQWGTGGIATKLHAAQLAAAAGVTTVILSAKRAQDIAAVVGGAKDVGTRFIPLQVRRDRGLLMISASFT